MLSSATVAGGGSSAASNYAYTALGVLGSVAVARGQTPAHTVVLTNDVLGQAIRRDEDEDDQDTATGTAFRTNGGDGVRRMRTRRAEPTVSVRLPILPRMLDVSLPDDSW